MIELPKARLGEDFVTVAEHLNRMRKKRPKAMICILELPDGDVSCAVHGDNEQMTRMFTLLAMTPDMAPYIMAVADIVSETLGLDEDHTPQ